jgi:dTDP-4-amino-4,6-dideoxygalactose transaminase
MNTRKVPFSKVVVGESERKYLNEVLESGWLTTASKTLEFEKRFAQSVGAKYACAVNSCTAALHLAVDALGVKAGGKVFIPSMTFTATAEVVRYVGAHPVLIDTEFGSNLITPEILEYAIRNHPDIKHLIVVHYGGQAADMPAILELCNRHDIQVIEDAAHAFPSRFESRMVGGFSKITCFSFYANKTITSGEGGMLVTDDEEIYKRVKVMRLHGISRDIWDRFTSDKPSWEYDVIDAGYKYNMPDLCAAIGLGQLEQAELFRSERERVARIYFNELSELNSIDLPLIHVSMQDHAWHLFQLVLNNSAPLNRNAFIEEMAQNGVGTSVHYKPIHQLTYYKEKYRLLPSSYPNAERTWQGTVSLPIYPFMPDEDIRYVCDVVRKILC